MNVSVTQKRIIAYLVDIFLCYIGVMIFIQWMFLAYFRESLGLDESWFYNRKNRVWYDVLLATIVNSKTSPAKG